MCNTSYRSSKMDFLHRILAFSFFFSSLFFLSCILMIVIYYSNFKLEKNISLCNIVCAMEWKCLFIFNTQRKKLAQTVVKTPLTISKVPENSPVMLHDSSKFLFC